MPRELLSAKKLPTTKGKHRDGAGLFLQVAAKGQASWVYQYRWHGETRWMSIGPAATFTLKEARDRHHELRRLRDRDIDPRAGFTALPYTPSPLLASGAQVETITAPALKPSGMLFGEAVEKFIADIGPQWVGGIDGQEARAYRNTLTGTSFARLAVNEITTDHVLAAIKPWDAKPTTAEKVLKRIGKVLGYATAKGLRTGDNPARIKGHIEFLARPVVPVSQNHPAMPAAGVPRFMAELRALGTTEARALSFVILTAVRTGEALGAKWQEINGNVWTIPADRMKGKKGERVAHSVPLTPAALKLLGKPGAPDDYIFGSRRYGPRKPLWHASMQTGILNQLRPGLHVHGFRSTFRDWVAESGYSHELGERALSHVIGNKSATAYQRSKLVEQRRPLMTAWAKFAGAR